MMFPNFVQARSRLLLEDITQNDHARTDGSSDDTTVLSIGNTARGSSGGTRGDRAVSGNQADKGMVPTEPSSCGNRGRGRWRGCGRGHGHPGAGSTSSTPAGRGSPQQPLGVHPWMGYFAPYGRPFPPP
ncbi:hypothetical protein D1007_21456 [Hordeum vulgare]|nr:hypothetical protein D1007_21456 [Hordeum vulgare]